MPSPSSHHPDTPLNAQLWLYERAMAASSTGIVIADATKPHRPLIYCNPAFERITGYTRDEAIGRNCRFLQGDDTDPAAIEKIRQALRNESECHVILKNYRKDGTPFWNELTLSPVRDSQGQLTHFIGVQNDITERKQAEETLEQRTQELARSESALRKQTQILQMVLDSMADGVMVADKNGEFLMSNPAVVDIVGSPFEAGKPANFDQQSPLYGCYKADTITRYHAEDLPLTRAIKGESVDAEEIFIRHPNHPEGLWVSANARPLDDPTEGVKGGVVVFRNITERKKAEKALQNSEAQLREQATQLKQALKDLQNTQTQLIHSEKMSSLGQLVAGIAHEINNPISFIYGNISHAHEYIRDLLNLLSLYQEKYPTPDPQIETEIKEIGLDFILEDLPKLLASMKQGAERIRQIVLNLRNFSRLDESQIKPVNLHEGIDSTLEILEHRLKATKIRPTIQIIKEYTQLPKVECSAGSLNQVLMNLLNNAIDAVEQIYYQKQREPLTIRIQTAIEAQWAIIRVIDNGTGMEEDVCRHIFEPFFTTKPIGKGTGLGLSIAYQVVVEKHGGQLLCRSTPGSGTEITIKIPLQRTNMTSEMPPVRAIQLQQNSLLAANT
jgi:two-component system NtrC family sensor kinase